MARPGATWANSLRSVSADARRMRRAATAAAVVIVGGHLSSLSLSPAWVLYPPPPSGVVAAVTLINIDCLWTPSAQRPTIPTMALLLLWTPSAANHWVLMKMRRRRAPREDVGG